MTPQRLPAILSIMFFMSFPSFGCLNGWIVGEKKVFKL